MPLFRSSELKDLERHSWKHNPGLFSIDLLDKERLRDLAMQLGVPVADRITRTDEITASAKAPSQVGDIGGAQTQRQEAVYEQPFLSVALRRVIDRLWSRQAIDEVPIGATAVDAEVEGDFDSDRERDNIARAVYLRNFVIAEAKWSCRQGKPPRLHSWFPQSMWRDPLEDAPPPPWLRSSQELFPLPQQGRRRSDGIDVPLGELAKASGGPAGFNRRLKGENVHACVFGDALEWDEKQTHLVIGPVAVFERRGGGHSFRWSARRERWL